MQRLSLLALMSLFFTPSLFSSDLGGAAGKVDSIPVDTIYDFDLPVTVLATAAREDTPVAFTNLSAPELAERNLGQDAPYLLKWTPSVVVNSDAGTGIGYTGIWIRGSDPTRTNVTINGIPYNDSESQGVFWVNLPDFSSSASSVQIQRGVGTSTNGAGAFGATINFTTGTGRQAPGFSIDGGIGSFGTRRGKVSYRSGALENGISVEARYSKIHSDGYVDRATADLDGYYASLAKTDDRSVWRFVAFGGHEITYQSWNGVTQAQIDQFGRTYNSVGTEKEGEPYDNEVDNYRQNHYQLHYSTALTGGLDLAISGHYTRGLGFFEQYKADQAWMDYGITGTGNPGDPAQTTDLIRRLWLDNHFYGTVYSLRRQRGAWDITLGGSANEYLGDHYGEVIWARNAGSSEIRDRYYENDAEKRDFSNYLRANYRVSERVSAYADAQVRHVDYTFLGLDEELRRVDQSEQLTFFNPKAGFVYTPKAGSRAYASVGVAHREPNRNDFVDNPARSRPRPERLIDTEIGYERTGDRFNYAINGYYMVYRDQLVLTGQLNEVGEYVRTNVDESYRLGVELQGGVALNRDFTLGGNLTLSRNRVENYVEFLDDYDENFGFLGQSELTREDTPLSFSPSLTAAAELGYTRTLGEVELSGALQAKYVGDRYVDNSGEDASRLAAYYYSDLRLGLNYRSLRFSFLLRNLTDQLYFSNGWSYRYNFAGTPTTDQGLYPQAGRNFLLGVGWDF